MVRRYDEPVEVSLAAGPDTEPGTPATFRWRGRRYRVRVVQARWRERRAWWRDVGEDRGEGEDRDVGEDRGATERVLWRVEAAAGASTGVFELGADGGSRWLLVRTLD